MSVRGETDQVAEIERLRSEVERLKAELEHQKHEAAARENQLLRHTADLGEIFKKERESRDMLANAYRATVTALANAVEARDRYTGKHAERVAAYGLEIIRQVDKGLAEDPSTEFGFLLHDVGKVGIADAILLKDGPLSAEERALMQQHPVIGETIVRDFLRDGTAVVRSHHERWDGHGYPDGMGGEEIPLVARAFAVADVLDALTTNRPYRPASPLSVARTMIVAGSGRHFDPQAIEAFRGIPDERFLAIGAAIP